ncbi:MAG: D-alanine--D-alanine ligase [Elstera sp.]|jgi:D-alanine-D-alanine ligase|uniref:D-alanine--D-alanine ligase n=1 Tax=Elstera sp. TaxID=1916664 RepID=UPI0037C195B7
MSRFHRIAVLMGGWSAERPVSLASGVPIAAALREKGFEVTEIDAPKDPAALIAALTPKPDAVFNALHGTGGEDGRVQAILDLLEIPYTHSGVLASALAMNKPAAKRVFAAEGLRVPGGAVYSKAEVLAGDVIPRPYVVKPPAEGSSFGVQIVRAGDNGPAVADWGFGDEVLVEPYIAGRELTVAVVDDPETGEARALGAIEIRHAHGFFDYEAKYKGGEAEHIMPPDVPESVLAELYDMGVRAHKALGCRGVSRSDFRYDDTQGSPGTVWLLETNTQPGMTPTSLVPDAARSRGISFADLVVSLVEQARWG